MTLNASSPQSIPSGSRLYAVRGEADGKPTYDFSVTEQAYDGPASALRTVSVKYAGTKNGKQVLLMHDWPAQTTSSTAPTAQGGKRVFVSPGNGVVLQIYYLDPNAVV